MKFKFTAGSIMLFFFSSLIWGQTETYSIIKTSFSSDRYDEFSPVYYKNSLVFSTNRQSGSFSNYSDDSDNRLIKIYSVEKKSNDRWKKPQLFSKNLTTRFNDGPVTFNSTEDTIFYSRNQKVEGSLRKLAGVRNNLGIFYAVFEEKDWAKAREMRFNNEWHNISTPWLSPDGRTLYFASDEAGYGGSDLFFSQWKDAYWSNPENMGAVINTKGNEAYPFVNQAGEFFFSSDGHPGLGGKDIFYSRLEDAVWITPIRLESPINSEYDDFGIITDTFMNEGFFSSNRDKTFDIYYFKTKIPQIFYNNIQRENPYCFTFNGSGDIKFDTLKLKYLWDFGDGNTAMGELVNHCFPEPGIYNVKLNIIDRKTNSLYFTKLTYTLDVRNSEGPYINCPDYIIKGDPVIFDGQEANLPGYTIVNFSWNFGDGSIENGSKVSHLFKESGEYYVNLVLTLKSESTGKLIKKGTLKKVIVLNSDLESESLSAKKSNTNLVYTDFRKNSNVQIKSMYSAENQYKQETVFQVELLSSITKLRPDNPALKNISKKFEVYETYDQTAGLYRYIAGRQFNLMDIYSTYKQIVSAGFNNAFVRMTTLDDPAEKELYKLIKIFGNLTDTYFDDNNRLSSNSFLLFDQIVRVMNEFPEIKLEVNVHTDNRGSSRDKLKLSQVYAQVIVDYLKNKGIAASRLMPRGMGDSKPIFSEGSIDNMRKNRRVDFKITR